MMGLYNFIYTFAHVTKQTIKGRLFAPKEGIVLLNSCLIQPKRKRKQSYLIENRMCYYI